MTVNTGRADASEGAPATDRPVAARAAGERVGR